MNGIINLLKPPGITSFKALNLVKRHSPRLKIGHTGTLDPAATGVLPLCLGKATKIADMLLAADKAYWCEVVLGLETDTLDGEGTITAQRPVNVTPSEVEAALESFLGVTEQVPPVYSALKIAGRPAYQRQREGEIVELPPRPVEVYTLTLLKIDLPLVRFSLTCSKGTYIRSLARDLGDKLATGAYLNFLIRTQAGPYLLEDCCTIEEIAEKGPAPYLKPIDSALEHLPKVELKEPLRPAIKAGRRIHRSKSKKQGSFADDALYRLYLPDGEFAALGKYGNESFHPFKVFI